MYQGYDIWKNCKANCSGHKDKQPKETWLSPHARNNQHLKWRSDPTIGRGDIEY
jgi:hypothetical protein